MDLSKKNQTRGQKEKIVYPVGSYGYDKKKKNLHKQAWKLLSEIIRSGEASGSGKVNCYTCGREHSWKDTDCGHFEHGGTSGLSLLDFCEDNLRVQCKHCNKYLKGNLGVYAANLTAEIGLVRVLKIYTVKREINKMNQEDYKVLIAGYKERLAIIHSKNT